MDAERDEQASKRARIHFSVRDCNAFYETLFKKKQLLIGFNRDQERLITFINRCVHRDFASVPEVVRAIMDIMDKIKELDWKLKCLESMQYPGLASCFLDFVQNLADWCTHARMQWNLYKVHGDSVNVFYRHYMALAAHRYGPAPAPILSTAWNQLVENDLSTHAFTSAFFAQVPTMYFFEEEESEVYHAYERFKLYGIMEEVRRGPNKDKTRHPFGADLTLTSGRYHMCALMCSVAYAGTKFELPVELWDAVFKNY